MGPSFDVIYGIFGDRVFSTEQMFETTKGVGMLEKSAQSPTVDQYRRKLFGIVMFDIADEIQRREADLKTMGHVSNELIQDIIINENTAFEETILEKLDALQESVHLFNDANPRVPESDLGFRMGMVGYGDSVRSGYDISFFIPGRPEPTQTAGRELCQSLIPL